MITFILIIVAFLLVIGFGFLAYSSNNRKRAAQKDAPAPAVDRPAQHRAAGPD